MTYARFACYLPPRPAGICKMSRFTVADYQSSHHDKRHRIGSLIQWFVRSVRHLVNDSKVHVLRCHLREQTDRSKSMSHLRAQTDHSKLPSRHYMPTQFLRFVASACRYRSYHQWHHMSFRSFKSVAPHAGHLTIQLKQRPNQPQFSPNSITFKRDKRQSTQQYPRDAREAREARDIQERRHEPCPIHSISLHTTLTNQNALVVAPELTKHTRLVSSQNHPFM